MPPKKATKKAKPEVQTGTLHLEWFPAYGIRIREMPHVTVIAPTYEKALQHLATLGYDQRRNHNTDYDMVFVNEPFIIE